MKVAVFGLGYVGCVTAACLARNGHTVVGVDVSDEKVAMINAAQPPIVEPGLADLLETVVSSGALRATADGAAAVRDTDIALVCVGTPGTGHGQPSFDAIRRVGRGIGAAIVDRATPYVVVLRSTALPGTTIDVLGAAVREGAGSDAPPLSLAVNPEFMREGASLHDFDHPPFIVIGADDEVAARMVAEMYRGVDGEVVQTSIRTAELVKYASNAYHALKICFANEMADLAAALGADGRDVMRVFAMDRKLNVSPAYLRPGFAFGGSCLPKDVRALNWAGHVHEVATPVLSAILPSNRHRIDLAIDTVLSQGRRRIGVVGLAFKAATDDLRESPTVTVVEALLGRGLDVRILDRHVSMARLMGANKRYIEGEIPHIASLLCDDPASLLEHAEVLVIGTHDEDAKAVLAAAGDRTVIDLARVDEYLKPSAVPQEHSA
jgi:GDP-mannose 6-dehydrogenase